MNDESGIGHGETRGHGIGEAARSLRHDLKTPIHQILGYAGLVMDELTAKGWTSALPDLQRIQDAAKKLDALLDRLAMPSGATARGDPFQEEGGAGPAAPK